jgi:hypothetical protein
MTTTEYADPAFAGRYRDALASPEFRALSGASLASSLGYVAAILALTVLVYRQTSSPLLSALTFTTAFVPYLFGGTLLSGLVDRVPARRLLIACNLGEACVVPVMTLPGVPVAGLFGSLFAVSLPEPLSAGAKGALLPEVLPAGAVVPGRSLLRLVGQGAQSPGTRPAAGCSRSCRRVASWRSRCSG